MYSVKEMFDDIVLIAGVLEEHDIDNFKFPKGISEEEIKNWEKENSAVLPKGYKSFLLLADGFRNHGSEIYPLGQITRLEVPEEYRGYYAIGSYIGDGSLILADEYGNFYYGDHVYGTDKSTFEEFVEKWILDNMKEALKDNGVKMPENRNTDKQ